MLVHNSVLCLNALYHFYFVIATMSTNQCPETSTRSSTVSDSSSLSNSKCSSDSAGSGTDSDVRMILAEQGMVTWVAQVVHVMFEIEQSRNRPGGTVQATSNAVKSEALMVSKEIHNVQQFFIKHELGEKCLNVLLSATGLTSTSPVKTFVMVIQDVLASNEHCATHSFRSEFNMTHADASELVQALAEYDV